MSIARLYRGLHIAPLVLLLLLQAPVGADAVAAQESPTADSGEPEPFADFRAVSLEYAGPGRGDTPPDELSEVLIGWFGPSDPQDPLFGDLWVAAELALEQANEEGGYGGIPFRLLPRWSENPWGTGVSSVARMVYEDRVWAIVGSVDGPTTHLAEQIVAKARLPLVSPVSTDKSVNLAGVSWMFSLAPGDHLWAPTLVDALLQTVGPDGELAMLAATDHDSRLASDEIRKVLAEQDRGPGLSLDVSPGALDFSRHLERISAFSPRALLVVATAEDSARVIVALRQQTTSLPIFGSPWLGRRRFLDLAGEAADGVRFPFLLGAGTGDAHAAFRRIFQERSRRQPDWAAVNTFDAVRLLVAAIRAAGLNRARIRDALAELSPWQGIAGPIEWDPTGQNRRSVTTMAIICAGEIRQSRCR